MGAEYEEQLIDWVQLIRSENVGPVTFWILLNRYGSAKKALEAINHISLPKGRKVTLCSRSQASREIEAHLKQKYSLLAGFQAEYPDLLKQIPDAPPILSVYGSIPCLSHHGIGMVGARNASLASRQLAEKLAYGLVQSGFIVISGLARGIDKHAHIGALTGGTIGVLAGGVDVIYPPEHEALYHDIVLHGGAVISEMPLTLYPGANHFPRRNRIISGLSLAVVVVEAAIKSGSLITAQFAFDQNRELLSVPGSPMDPRCRGTNQLLRQGAHLVESLEDILRVVQIQPIPYKEATCDHEKREERASCPEDGQLIDTLQKRLLQDLTSVPVSLDYLLGHYQCSYADISMALLGLELSGHVQRTAANKVCRIFNKE